MKECTSCAVPYLSAVRAFFPLTELFIATRVERAITKIASLTRKVAGIVWAVFLGPFYPMLPFKTAENEKWGGWREICCIMTPDRFWYTMKNRFANTPARISKPARIPVCYGAFTSNDHSIGRGPGQREIHCLQRLGLCLSDDHDRFEQCCVFHSLTIAHNSVNGTCICRGFTMSPCRDENRDKVVLKNT